MIEVRPPEFENSGILASGLSVRALRNLHAGPCTFDVPAGDCLLITGASGSGKSVLLRMMADLDPHQGDVALDGLFCSAMPAHLWRQAVYYMSAEPGWWSDAVLDHLPDDALTRSLMTTLALKDDVLVRPLHRLSTGERQRLALIRGLHHKPRALLLDEPCSALDEATTLRVEALIHQIMSEGTTVVLVSHDPAQAARMGTRHLEMAHGRFVEGAP